ncbi:MAG: DUF2142 domain-containing protein [Anaerolineales bacterium]|nr:DUF2142 domain-containing protein [Anaerolineales bacterium]
MSNQTSRGMNWIRSQRFFLVILLAALVHGLLYVFLMPPWQHYDEPNHFEVAWLIAKRSHWPEADEYDQEMRRQVAISMIENDFFATLGFLPNLDAVDEPIWIGGFNQADEPPLYYLLLAIPLRLLSGQDIEVQLFAARIVSLTLYLATVIACWGVMGELTRPKEPSGSHHPLRWVVPLALGLWPAAADLMTSINNDVLAVAAFSVFLWGSARLIQHGATLATLVWSAAAAGLCLLAKEMVFVAPLLLVVALLFALLRGKHSRRLAWGLLAVSGIAGLGAVFSWGDAAVWYRSTNQSAATRIAYTDAPMGNYVYQIDLQPGEEMQLGRLYQMIPAASLVDSGGQPVTLGAWMWASQPVQFQGPVLVASGQETGVHIGSQVFSLTETPTYYSFTASFPSDVVSAWVMLSAPQQELSAPVHIYLDGVVAALGSFAATQPPLWNGNDGEDGVWNGQPFANLLRNGSAEAAGLRLRSWVDVWGSKILPDRGRPSLILYSLLDGEAGGQYYRQAFTELLKTFWGKFGWGHVPLLGGKPYRLVAWMTAMAFIGCLLLPWRRAREWPWAVFILLGLAMVFLWGMALTRGAVYLFYRSFIPGARYAFPAIIPTLALFYVGWHTLAIRVVHILRLPEKVVNLVGIFLLLSLDLYAVLSIIQYYHG